MREGVRFGLFPRLLINMLCLSLLPMGLMVYFAYTAMTDIRDLVLEEGRSALETLGERAIEEKARDVAKQLEIYIRSHPDLTVKDLQQDDTFRSLAVQPVGKTGYTAVQDAHTAVNRFHINPKIVNMDLHTLASKLPRFWEIMERSLGGRDSDGYYDWTDADGKTRRKYMYITTVNALTADGALLGVAATTYLDEFSQPMVALEQSVKTIIQGRLFLFYVVLSATFLAVVIAVFLISRAITHPILHLARVADTISTGKLSTPIDISRGDEIGVLAISLRRMQRSLALAIRKLRERASTRP